MDFTLNGSPVSAVRPSRRAPAWGAQGPLRRYLGGRDHRVPRRDRYQRAAACEEPRPVSR